MGVRTGGTGHSGRLDSVFLGRVCALGTAVVWRVCS